jgi:hypothetical protein
MPSVNLSIPSWARVLSGNAALLSGAVLVWYFLQIAPGGVSAKHIVFIAPIVATIFAAYIAIVGRMPNAFVPKRTAGRNA